MKSKKVHMLTTLVFLLDQIIKVIVIKNMDLYSKIKVIPNFFSIYYVKNTGAAFSILKDNTIFLIILSAIVLVIIDYYINNDKTLDKKSLITLGIISGGIYGNLIDRILHKGVIDYLSFTIFKYEFPIFNLADIAITLGTLTLIVFMIFTNTKKNNTERSSH